MIITNIFVNLSLLSISYGGFSKKCYSVTKERKSRLPMAGQKMRSSSYLGYASYGENIGRSTPETRGNSLAFFIF